MSIISAVKPYLPYPVKTALVGALKFIPAKLRRRVDQRRRLDIAMSYLSPQLKRAQAWARLDSEMSNFIYDLTPMNREYLAHLLAEIFETSPQKIREIFKEIDEDAAFNAHVQGGLTKLLPDVRNLHIGRRLGWYAIARLNRPRLVVETGVDFGLGSCVLCAALLRNAEEGFPGRYIGTELRSEAGQLLTGVYSTVGKIAYGDSLKTLRQIEDEIDLFINDSDHSAEYEAQEYEAIAGKLSKRAFVLGDNSHVTLKLAEFSERTGRRFNFFKEQPLDHWYPGAGIGISFSDRVAARTP